MAEGFGNLTVSITFVLETVNGTGISSGVSSDCGLLLGANKNVTISLDVSSGETVTRYNQTEFIEKANFQVYCLIMNCTLI